MVEGDGGFVNGKCVVSETCVQKNLEYSLELISNQYSDQTGVSTRTKLEAVLELYWSAASRLRCRWRRVLEWLAAVFDPASFSIDMGSYMLIIRIKF